MDQEIPKKISLINEFYAKLNLSNSLKPIIGKPLEKLLIIDKLDY